MYTEYWCPVYVRLWSYLWNNLLFIKIIVSYEVNSLPPFHPSTSWCSDFRFFSFLSFSVSSTCEGFNTKQLRYSASSSSSYKNVYHIVVLSYKQFLCMSGAFVLPMASFSNALQYETHLPWSSSLLLLCTRLLTKPTRIRTPRALILHQLSQSG